MNTRINTQKPTRAGNMRDLHTACRNVRDLPHAAHCVLVYLAEIAQQYGAGVYPTHQTIAENTILSTRTIMRALVKLEEAGYITRVGPGVCVIIEKFEEEQNA